MKNKLTIIAILLFIISIFNFNIISNSYANESSGNTWSWWIDIIITEKIPGANCSEIDNKWKPWKAKEGETQMYKCKVAKWVTSVTQMLWKMIKYFTYIASLWWVLYIVINGVLYSLWWIEQSMKDESKKRIVATLIWLILLFISWVILNLIAPWIYK
jgi:lysylphosphatidylglycerol synthetase-like protein (DUF2156 family)